jgi:1-deoxy-D-xylulose-5-phosphate synthase
MTLLKSLTFPDDLRRLSLKDLDVLAEEVRALIIDVVSKNGGHLSSNLGVVELTIAIHTALRSPIDKIIWDVGHQSYAHKILTGRVNDFSTIRQYKGLSGFPSRKESGHDCFGAGHAATSLSAAVGMAKARDLKNEDYSVLAVIGDSSISSGEAFEAINNIRSVKGPFIVILNDNEMSISPAVGALSEHITSLRYNFFYRGVKRKAERLLLKLPLGKPLVHSIDTMLRRSKHLLINYEKMGVIYEELGFRYLGPIDATNTLMIMSAIRHAKTAREPVLIHVRSVKGKGYPPAEKDPSTYHGMGKFDPVTGKSLSVSKSRSYTDAFSDCMVSLAKKNQLVVAITAGMTDGTGLTAFSKQFPDRFMDVGIAEEHAVTMAGGLAASGIKPFVVIYSTFMQRSFDQIIHDVALQNLPVVFAMDRSGVVGEDGPTHHGVFDLAFLRMIPKLIILAPKDEQDFIQMMSFSATYNEGPIAIRYPKRSVPTSDMPHEDFEVGKAEWLLKSPKSKVSVLAIGSMVATAYEAITDNNLAVKLINIRSLKPFDHELIIESTKNSSIIITLEEGVKQGGLYGAVSECCADQEGHRPKVVGYGIESTEFVAHGAIPQLLSDLELDISSITKNIKKHIKEVG